MKPWPYPRIIAHRGGGTLAPENTLAGMRKAKQLGFAGVEFDVMLAGDATPILMHDETLARTTSGRGAIAATAYRDMLTLDAGSWFSAQHAGEPVPSFEQAGRLCGGNENRCHGYRLGGRRRAAFIARGVGRPGPLHR